jgi:DNA repair exonuclease SbcCD ATPase subunit
MLQKMGEKAMKRSKTLIVSMVMFLFAISIVAVQARAATKEEITKLQNDLTDANKKVMAYKDNFLASPQIVALKKEAADLGTSLKTKAKELEDLLDVKYNKNPEFVDLSAKVKEADAINSELTKIHNSIESEPEIKNMKKEAADLRAKALTIEQEAKKLLESKFSSDKKVKELQDKKANLGNAAAKLANLRKDVMNSPEVKALQAEIAKLKDNLTTKANELRKTSDSTLKILNSDEKFKALEQNVKDLRQKVENLRKAKASPVTPTPKAK